MVCKDEVWLWFRDNEPHRRLELVCGLLNMCLPMELRFISTCVEDLGKRDFHDLREAEYKANNTQEIKRLSNLLDERTRSNLIVYIALLSGRNYMCSSLLYQSLVEAQQDPPLTDVNHIKEMLLVYTMVLHHPAFTFEQKRVIAELHERASRLEAQLSQHQELDTHMLEAFPGCTAAPEGCDSGLSVGTEPEGDTLLEGCTLLPTPASQLQYHQHTQGLLKSVGELGTSQTSPEGAGSQDACSSGSVALTPSYPYSHGNIHYYQYPPVVGSVARCTQDGKGSISEGSSSEEGLHHGPVQNGPPTSSSPLSSPQSSPYVSPLQSLSPSRASSPMSRPTTTTATTTTTTAASFPLTVTSSITVPNTNPGLATHSSPRSGHKSPVGITQASVTHGGTHTVSSHRGKPPFSGVRSQRQSDRSASRSRLPTGSSGESEILHGAQTPQNSPTSLRGTTHAQPNAGSQAKNVSRWSGSHPATSPTTTTTTTTTITTATTTTTLPTTSTSPSCLAPSSSNNKNAIKQNSQSPSPSSNTATACRISSAANSPVSKTANVSNLPCSTVATTATNTTPTTTITTTTLSTSVATPVAGATTITTSATCTTVTTLAATVTAATTTTTATTARNTSPPIVVHGGNQDKNAHTISTNSSVRPVSSIVGSNSINSFTLEKCPVNNNNCLNQDYIKHERLSKYSHQLANRPVDKLKRMSDREILELGLTRGALTKLRRVLATIENSSNHIPNGFTNHSVIVSHQCTSTHGSFSPSHSHAPTNTHPVVSSTAHSLNISQTCSQNQHSTTNQGKTGGIVVSEASQNSSQKTKHSPSNTLSYCKESSGSQFATDNSASGSLASLQGSISNVVPSATTLPNNAPTTTTTTSIATLTTLPTPTLTSIPASVISSTTATITNSTAITQNSGVNTSTVSTNIASTMHVTQCHSATISSNQKGPVVSSQPPSNVSSTSVETTSPNTSVSNHGTHPPPVSVTSQTRPSVLTPPASVYHYINSHNTPPYITPPPPIPLKTTPPPTGLPQLPITSQPPPNQHRTSPPSLCVPPRTPSQEPCIPTTTSGLVNNGSQQVYYNSCGPGGKNLPSVSSAMNAAGSSMNVAGYTAPPTGNPPHSSAGGSVGMPVYSSAGSMPVYTSSSGIGVPPPNNGGLMPMVPPGGHYPAYLYPVLGGPGGTHSYVPPGPYGVQQPHRSYYFSQMPQMGSIPHLKAAPPHHGTPMSSVIGSRGGSCSSSSSSSSSSSTRMNKGNPRGQSQIKVSSQSSDSSPSSSQYSSPPQTPSPDHTRDNLPDKRGKAHGDGAEMCETGEHLGLLGSGASEGGTPPPFHHPPHPVLLPPQANLNRHRGIPYPQLSYLGFHHSGPMRYPGPPLPNQGPLMPPRNPLPVNNDKSSRETTPPAPGALPLGPPDPHCCVRSPEGIAVPSSLAGNNHGRNGGSPHAAASHPDGSQPPVTHTPVPSGASAPTGQVPPGNSCTGAPHNSVQYNAPGYQMVQVFPHFTGFMPTHSSLANGFVSPPMPPSFAIPNMGSGINPEFVYSGGQYSILGGTTQSGGGPSPACGTPAGMGGPTPGLGLAAGMPYTHYPPNLPHAPNPSAGAKKSCYNCGKVGHHGSECKEANIEEMCNLPKAARS